jgi:hypothetical protein
MKQLMKSMVDESGQLMGVECFYYTDLPTDIGFIKLAFQQNHYFVVATEDDSLEVTDNVANLFEPNDFKCVDMSDRSPWQSAIGKQVRWIWTMVNQQGYLDGLQFEFANDISQKPVVLQLIAIASGIDIYKRISLSQPKIESLLNGKSHDHEDRLMEAVA